MGLAEASAIGPPKRVQRSGSRAIRQDQASRGSPGGRFDSRPGLAKVASSERLGEFQRV